MDAWYLLLEIVILLGGCLLLGSLAAALRQSPLVGYLAAGMILGGPGSLQLVKAQDHIAAIAELGVALLLFSLGLEFNWPRLRGLGGRVLLGGVLQVVLTLLVAAGIAAAAGLGLPEALAVGTMVSLSSTAAVLRLLSERSELDSLHGRAALGTLLVQDASVVPLALLLTLLGSGQGGDALPAAGRVLLLTLLFVVGLFLLLDVLAARLLVMLRMERNREMTVLLAALTGLGSAWAAHEVGLSPALGAFLARLFLGTSPFALQLRADIASLKVLLLTLFFGAAGMVADPIWISENILLVAALTLLLVGGKAMTAAGALRLAGNDAAVSAGAGTALGQVGEFAFVLGGIAMGMDLLASERYLAVISAAILSLFLTPYLVCIAPGMSAWVARRSGSRRPVDRSASEEVWLVAVGYGPAGREALKDLRVEPSCAVVVDLNRDLLRAAETAGYRTELGDAAQPEVLEHAGVERAGAVVVTLPDRAAALGVVRQVRAMNPAAQLVVRARYQIHVDEFRAAGAHVVVGEEETVGRELAAAVARLVDAPGEG